jgi:glycosyltransferase involved in cell wall biosynthesis
MRLGKPVIATDYSANRDYLNESNGFPVRYTLVELERDYGPYRAGNVWAQPDLAHAAALMRQAADDPEEGRRRGLRAAADMERLYSPRAVARRMIERLRAG